MRKSLIAAALALAAATLNAKPVTPDQALVTAEEFAQQHSIRKAAPRGDSGLELAYTQVSAVDGTAAAFYVFTGDNRFVIVSGDDRADAVLAYGNNALDMSNMPPSLQFFIDLYQEQIDFLHANPDVMVGRAAMPAREDATTAIEPLITATWDQSRPYYNQCPMVGNSRCLTGCPATSLSMVFYYWQYPFVESPTVPSHTFSYRNRTYTLDALPPMTFDWENMLDSYEAGGYNDDQANAVAWLMRYVGQAEEMEYGPDGSGSYGPNIEEAVRLFGYDEGVQNVYKSGALDGTTTTHDYTDDEWSELILNELENERPIVYCGYSGSGWSMAGHAFNVDGYDGAGKYHVNFGWSGEGNGYYALNAFSYGGYTFNRYQEMIIGIQPPPDAYGSALRARPAVVNLSTLVDSTTTATFTVKGWSLTDKVTLTLNDNSGAFSITPDNISVDAVTDDWQQVTVTFTPRTYGLHTATVVCSSPDVEDLIITLNGTGQLVTFAPVMLAPDTTAVTLNSFVADWTDQTNRDNVASYTLEVNPVAPVIVLDSADWTRTVAQAFNMVSHADEYMPDGWTFNGKFFYLETGAVSVGRNGTITTPAHDLSSHGKVSVIVTSQAYSSSSKSTLSVATASNPDSTVTLTLGVDIQTDTIVLDAADIDQVVFTAGYYPKLRTITILAGDVTDDHEVDTSNSATYRLVNGITDMTRGVHGLQQGSTLYYWVRANYVDGTISDWSNLQRVTLTGEPEPALTGDVNGDGEVSVADVNAIIDLILSGGYTDAADVNADGEVTIADVNAVIDIILAN